jgi:uncharacterized protein YndB with AHSA1/START domain
MSHALGGAHALTLSRLIPAPRAAIWRCWTEPELLKQWFCPKPWGVSHAEMDVRPGGSSLIVMRGPEGQEMPNRGLYLEVVPGERLVFTDAFTSAWVPSGKPFMVGTILLADAAGGTQYDAVVGHWNEEDCAQHEAMGFHQGWGIATDQLTELARTLG